METSLPLSTVWLVMLAWFEFDALLINSSFSLPDKANGESPRRWQMALQVWEWKNRAMPWIRNKKRDTKQSDHKTNTEDRKVVIPSRLPWRPDCHLRTLFPGACVFAGRCRGHRSPECQPQSTRVRSIRRWSDWRPAESDDTDCCPRILSHDRFGRYSLTHGHFTQKKSK